MPPVGAARPQPLRPFPGQPPPGQLPPIPLVHFATSQPPRTSPDGRLMRRFSTGSQTQPLRLAKSAVLPPKGARGHVAASWEKAKREPVLATVAAVGLAAVLACLGLCAYGVILLQQIAGRLPPRHVG